MHKFIISRNNKKENIYLGEKDYRILKNCFDYIALPLNSLTKRYYGKSSYSSIRLDQLFHAGLLHREYYYEQKEYAPGKLRTERKGLLYFCRRKGAVVLGIEDEYVYRDQDPINRRSNTLKPVFKDKFNIYYMIGKLFGKIPALLSRKETLQVYDLPNYVQVSCSIFSIPPLFIHILNKHSGSLACRILSFAQQQFRDANHIVVSLKHNSMFVEDYIKYIPWELADEIIANIYQNPNYYLDEFISLLRERDPRAKLLTAPAEDDFTQVKTSQGIYYIGELFSGSNILRKKLSSPLPNTLVYAYSLEQLRGIVLKKDKHFDVYLTQDQNVYRISLKGKKARTAKKHGHPLFR